MSEHDLREAQLEAQLDAIRKALANPGRQVPLPCDVMVGTHATASINDDVIAPVHADRFGRLWVWWPDEKMLKMIFDPREARG